MSSQLGAPPVPLALVGAPPVPLALVVAVALPVSWPHAAKRKPIVEERANPIRRGRMGSSKRRQGRQQSVAGSIGIAMPLPSPPTAGQVPGR
jgi:hypothetical protein